MMLMSELKIALVPDATASAPTPDSSAAILFSRTSVVGFISRVYMFPGSFNEKRADACSTSLNTYDEVLYIGTALASVTGSGSWPA
jgi:hypothetical protein